MKFLASASVLALFLTNSESVGAVRIMDNDSEKLKGVLKAIADTPSESKSCKKDAPPAIIVNNPAPAEKAEKKSTCGCSNCSAKNKSGDNSGDKAAAEAKKTEKSLKKAIERMEDKKDSKDAAKETV